jgi:hypothetical protein
MTGLMAILRKEVKNFFNSGWGVFFLYALISVVWSFMLFYEYGLIGSDFGIWSIFFAAIVASNFSGTVFISERVSGTLEVLIVSGVTRDAVLLGKMFFVAGATLVMGVVCAAVSAVWLCLLADEGTAASEIVLWSGRVFRGAFLYVGATILNVSASAYLSVRMGNPRFLHFANLFITGAAMAVYGLVSIMFDRRDHTTFVLIFLALGAVFLVLARREFAGERITRPVIF